MTCHPTWRKRSVPTQRDKFIVPRLNADPFPSTLITQAQSDQLMLVTGDRELQMSQRLGA